MITEKGCFAELLKMELMERYGLREDQVRLELTIATDNLELSRQILKDFDRSTYPDPYFERENQNCDSVFGKEVNWVSVHRKDGFYGTYLFDDAE